MKVSVVIPNCNGADYLKVCLNSLKSQTTKDFKVIIVDNGSSDDSLKVINEEYIALEKSGFSKNNLILIKNKENLGFCGAVNIGIKAVDTEYVILLNNDTEAKDDFIEQSVKGIEGCKGVFSVSSKMIQLCKKNLIDNAGDGYTIFGFGFSYGTDKNVKEYTEKREVFTACAGAAIYKTELVKRIGLFDENHFAYLEDIDIGYRAKIYGFKNMYNPKAIVYHVGSGFSGSKHNEFKIEKAARNNVYLLYKNQPLPQLIINLGFIVTGCVIKYMYFLKKDKKYGAAYIKGIKEGLKTYKKCKRVKYNRRNLKNYIKIEEQLIKNTFLYICEKA
ncbi:MAG: glycosyltransferase family 2 protein [Lachnospiraceae bacterium]|nr:glycosyltransferase family 2 protein [Lachnospiraceae bacterium]